MRPVNETKRAVLERPTHPWPPAAAAAAAALEPNAATSAPTIEAAHGCCDLDGAEDPERWDGLS